MEPELKTLSRCHPGPQQVDRKAHCRSAGQGRPEHQRRIPSAAQPVRPPNKADQAQRQRIQQSHSVTRLAASGQFLAAASGQISHDRQHAAPAEHV